MNQVSALVIVLLIASTAAADTAVPAVGAQAADPAPVGLLDAGSVDLNTFLWIKRPLVVFADTPADPNFQHQIEMLNKGLADLETRDVVVITDTDPAAASALRQKLRPRGFGLVWIDKDGAVRLRKPSPWTVREIVQAIDKTPLRRQEMLEDGAVGQ